MEARDVFLPFDIPLTIWPELDLSRSFSSSSAAGTKARSTLGVTLTSVKLNNN